MCTTKTAHPRGTNEGLTLRFVANFSRKKKIFSVLTRKKQVCCLDGKQNTFGVWMEN